MRMLFSPTVPQKLFFRNVATIDDRVELEPFAGARPACPTCAWHDAVVGRVLELAWP